MEPSVEISKLTPLAPSHLQQNHKAQCGKQSASPGASALHASLPSLTLRHEMGNAFLQLPLHVDLALSRRQVCHVKGVALLHALGLINLASPAQLLDAGVVEVGHLEAARAVSEHLLPPVELRCIHALPLCTIKLNNAYMPASYVYVHADDHMQTTSRDQSMSWLLERAPPSQLGPLQGAKACHQYSPACALRDL